MDGGGVQSLVGDQRGLKGDYEGLIRSHLTVNTAPNFSDFSASYGRQNPWNFCLQNMVDKTRGWRTKSELCDRAAFLYKLKFKRN